MMWEASPDADYLIVGTNSICALQECSPRRHEEIERLQILVLFTTPVYPAYRQAGDR